MTTNEEKIAEALALVHGATVGEDGTINVQHVIIDLLESIHENDCDSVKVPLGRCSCGSVASQPDTPALTLHPKAVEAIGWMYAEACVMADHGKDIRKRLVPDILESATKDLADQEAEECG